MASGRLPGGRGPARRGHDEEPRGPRVSDDRGSAGAARGAARRARAPEEGRAHLSRGCSSGGRRGTRRREEAERDRQL